MIDMDKKRLLILLISVQTLTLLATAFSHLSTLTYKVDGYKTYSKDTCIGDPDRDGRIEAAIAGYRYNGAAGRYEAVLKVVRYKAPADRWVNEGKIIWYVSGYDTYCFGVTIADVDKDGLLEIVTVGYYYDGANSRYVYQIRLYTKNRGNTFPTLKSSKTDYLFSGTMLYRVVVGDVDRDGQNEIIAVGKAKYDTTWYPARVVYSYSGGTWSLEAATRYAIEGYYFDVAFGDPDLDGQWEYAAVGRIKSGGKTYGLIRTYNSVGGEDSLTFRVDQLFQNR